MVSHRHVAFRPILLDRRRGGERRQKIIVARVVIGQRHLAAEDSAAFGPGCVRDERFEGQTFARLERDAIARSEVERLDVLDRAEPLLERRPAAIDFDQLDDEAGAAAIDHVFGLDDVIMVRRALAILGVHDLFGIEPAHFLMRKPGKVDGHKIIRVLHFFYFDCGWFLP